MVGWKMIRLPFRAMIRPIFRNELAVSFGFQVWIWCVSRFYHGKFYPFWKIHYFGKCVSYNSFQPIKQANLRTTSFSQPLAGSDLEYVIRRFSVWWRWCLRPWPACCFLTNGGVGQTELEDVLLVKDSIEGKKASNVANRVEFVSLKHICQLFVFWGDCHPLPVETCFFIDGWVMDWFLGPIRKDIKIYTHLNIEVLDIR